MRGYGITILMITRALINPDEILATYNFRKIYQKRLNGHVLRVIVEEHKGFNIIITTYKARSVRYEI